MTARLAINFLSNKIKADIILLVLLFAGLLFFTVLRFYAISKIGLQQGDAVGLLDASMQWAKGDFISHYWYRPGLYLLYAIPIKLFNNPLVSVKVLVASLDAAGFLMLAYLIYQLTKNKLLTLAGCLLYSSSPLLLQFARSEYPHIPASFFVLLAFALLIQYPKISDYKKKLMVIAASGMMLGQAWTIHVTMVILGLPFVVFIFLNEYATYKNNLFAMLAKHTVIKAFIFTLSYFVPLFIYMLMTQMTPVDVIENFRNFAERHNVAYSRFYAPDYSLSLSNAGTTIARIFGSYSKVTQSFPVVNVLFIVILIVSHIMAVIKIFTHKDIYFRSVLITLLLSYYCFISTFIFSGGFAGQERVLLNIYGITILLLILAFFTFERRLKGEHFVISIISLIIFAGFVCNMASGRFSRLYRPSHYQKLISILQDKVTDHSKVLLLPDILYYNDKAFQRDFAFGKNALYIRQFKYKEGNSLGKLITENQVGYIAWFNTHYDKRYYSERCSPKIDYYGLRKEKYDDYTAEKEKSVLDDYLGVRQHAVLARDNDLTVYELE